MSTSFLHNAQSLHLDDLSHIIWLVLFIQVVNVLVALRALEREGWGQREQWSIPSYGHGRFY